VNRFNLGHLSHICRVCLLFTKYYIRGLELVKRSIKPVKHVICCVNLVDFANSMSEIYTLVYLLLSDQLLARRMQFAGCRLNVNHTLIDCNNEYT